MKSLNDVWQNWRKYLKIMAVHNFKMILEFWNLCFNEFQRHMMRQVPDHGAKIQADPSVAGLCPALPRPKQSMYVVSCVSWRQSWDPWELNQLNQLNRL